MVIDYRAYSFQPGMKERFLELFRELGLPIQDRILGPKAFAGLFTTEFGDVNQVIHLWRYESIQEREEKRARLYQDLEFMDYVKQVRPIMTGQEVRLLNEVQMRELVIR